MQTIDIHELSYNTPVSTIFRCIESMDQAVWLDSGYPGQNHGRFDLISAAPEKTLDSSKTASKAEFINQSKLMLAELGSLQTSTSIPFKGGLIGYLGYDLCRQEMGLEHLPSDNKRQVADACFGLYLWACVYDHHSKTAQLIFHPKCDTELKNAILLRTKQTDAASKAYKSFKLLDCFQPSENRANYSKNIAKIDNYIRSGDVYQVNYSQHFSAPYQGSPSSAYLSQRSIHPAPYSAYMALKNQSILCHSPEQFLQIQGREVQTQPIKGTAPRAENPKIDQRNAEVLQSSSKDRAENLMIVDLLRNDLSKSCEPGTIAVPKLFELQSFSNVHHLVSEVRGRLEDGRHSLDLIADCHPGGSITGAPKRRAVEIIDELESASRSIYCGTIGFISCCGQSNMNIAIRTMVADGQKIHCWGGGGIVADSDADKEYQETLFKVGPMMHSLEESYIESDKNLYPMAFGENEKNNTQKD